MEISSEEHIVIQKDDNVFDLKIVHECFIKCEENNLDLAAYIEAYNNLTKFFLKLGGLFKFIVHDLSDKTRILDEYLKSEACDRYATVENMLKYEHESNILDDPQKIYTNGSRTLLRLHRALLFVIKLIDAIRLSTDDERIAPLARKAYDQTLAHFHPWLIRKGVHVAVHALPSRKQLVADIAGNQVTITEVNQIMEATVGAGTRVYEIIDRLYTEKNLHSLP